MSTPRLPAFHTGRITRLAALWLLALVLPLQGTAAVLFNAMGPAHWHRVASASASARASAPATAPASAPAPVLDDFRRWKSAAQPERHVLVGLGHFHAGSLVQRHRHAIDDASVVPAAADVADADEAATVVVVSVLAPIPETVVWRLPQGAAGEATGPLWPALTGFVPRLDRPPRTQG